jgi:diadenosine tetraphosphate (Ap4A) HIT family hydrolase
MIAGLEVPHTHIHLVPISSVRDLDFANADASADREDLEKAAGSIRQSLRELGASGVAE